MVLSHDLLVLTWITAIVNDSAEVQWGPTCQDDGEDLGDERPRNIASIEVVLEQCNGHEIYYECEDRADHHLVVDLVHLGEHVEDLADDQGAEGDRHDVCERLSLEYDD